MPVIQEAVDLSMGRNFIPNKARYKLPTGKTNNSIFLLSNSYEYDIELIKHIPSPKVDYKTIIIPFKVIDKIDTKPFQYSLNQNEYNKKVKYLEEQKLIPTLEIIRPPYPKTVSNNLYIPISEVIKRMTPYLRTMNAEQLQDSAFTIFNQIMSHMKWSQNRVMLIDTNRFTIYQTPTKETIKVSINAKTKYAGFFVSKER